MNFVIYTADCTGNKANCDYPHRVEVDSPDFLQEAVKKDHVCAEYKGNYRSNRQSACSFFYFKTILNVRILNIK